MRAFAEMGLRQGAYGCEGLQQASGVDGSAKSCAAPAASAAHGCRPKIAVVRAATPVSLRGIHYAAVPKTIGRTAVGVCATDAIAAVPGGAKPTNATCHRAAGQEVFHFRHRESV